MIYSLRVLGLLFLLLACSDLKAQINTDIDIREILDIQDQKKKVDGLIDLLDQLDMKVNLIDLGEIYHELAMGYSNLEDIENSKTYFEKAISIRYNLSNENFDAYNESRYNLSLLYKKNEESFKQHTLLSEIINDNRKDDNTCNAYMDIASNLVNRGDAFRAFNYLNIALADKDFTNKISNEVKIRCKIIYVYAVKNNNAFEYDQDNNDLEEVEHHLSEVEEKFAATNLPEVELIKAYNNACLTFDSYDMLDISLEKYVKTMKYYRSQNDTFNELEAMTNVAQICLRKNWHDEGARYSKEIISKSTDQEQIATAYINWAYYKNDSKVGRVPLNQKGIDFLLNRKKSKGHTFELPNLDVILESGLESDMIIYLIDLSEIYYEAFEESKDRNYLLRTRETLYLIDTLVSVVRGNNLNEASKLLWISSGVDTYILGAKTCYLLDDLEGAFYFMEKNKALLLQENIQSFQNKLDMNIPKPIFEREYKLRYEIASMQREINSSIDKIDMEEFKYKFEEHASLLDSLSEVYPDYSKAHKEDQISTLDYAKEKYLSDQSCFVEFILGDKEGYGIFCAVEGCKIFEIEDVKKLQKEINKFNYFLSQPLLRNEEIMEFDTIGKSIFTKLFPFQNVLTLIKNKKITIVPDQNIRNLPFEAFPVFEVENLSEKYLINQCEISYLHSVSLFQQIDKKINVANQKILGVAPYRYDYGGLTRLKESKTFISHLSAYDSSHTLIDIDATKSNFLNLINDFEIIHINTHGGVDTTTQEPWIAFRNSKMTLNELLGTENNAELVILDACKTNEGRLVSGEGIINLSRGFFYNGTKSVMSSLWNVNERAGNEIMTGFYEGLDGINTKSKALQNTKLKYLNKHKGNQILPYYWAVHTLTGDMSPINLEYIDQKTPFTTPILIFLGLVILLLMGWYFVKRRNN